jgi:hypothetical protein
MQISELELKMMAKNVSQDYLEKQASMNDTIMKLANSKGLNPHQVARICENANLNTYNAMWDKTGSGDFTFDCADQEKIAADMSSSYSPVLSEYTAHGDDIKSLLPTSEEISRTPRDADQFGKTAAAKFEQTIEEVNRDQGPSKVKLRKLAGKLGYYVSEIDSALFETNVMRKEAAINLRNSLKVAALRGENIAKVHGAALIAFDGKVAEIRGIFAEALVGLDKHGIDFKKHAKTYTEDAQGNKSEELNAVNKNHPILKHISTILDADELTPRLENSKQYIVKKIEVLSSRITDKKYDDEKESSDK